MFAALLLPGGAPCGSLALKQLNERRRLNLGVAQDFPQRPLLDRLRERNRNGRLRGVVHANVAPPLAADIITGALQRLNDLLPRNDRKFRYDVTSTSSTITSTSSGIGTPSSR